jgi:hypothetical protein
MCRRSSHPAHRWHAFAFVLRPYTSCWTTWRRRRSLRAMRRGRARGQRTDGAAVVAAKDRSSRCVWSQGPAQQDNGVSFCPLRCAVCACERGRFCVVLLAVAACRQWWLLVGKSRARPRGPFRRNRARCHHRGSRGRIGSSRRRRPLSFPLSDALSAAGYYGLPSVLRLSCPAAGASIMPQAP